MGFLSNLKSLATGKTEAERKQSTVANQLIRSKARAAAFREKEKQEIRLAVAKQKKYYNNKINNLNTNRKGSASVDIFGIAKQKLSDRKDFKII